jgi:glycosyltransferase involved in cell wall biosynthesis
VNILQLAPQVPYPLSDGGKVGIFNITKHLALRGHRITLLAFQRTKPIDTKPLERFCELVQIPHSNRNSMSGALLNLFSEEPYNIWKYRSRKYEAALRQLLDKRPFDVVHVDHLHMARYGALCQHSAGLPIVLREHNVESTIVKRYAAAARSIPFRHWLTLQEKKIRSYEAEQATLYDVCCVITDEDKQRLLELASKARVKVIAGGVDASFFEITPSEQKIPLSISMFGSFDWIPNRDALEWFLQSIFPRILQREPQVRLFIVGKDVPRNVRALHQSNVVVRGFADDLKEEVQKYEVTVVPLRIGGGMRLKILESFAMRVPVVSTSIGCEGIACKDEEHLLIGDTDELFADQVVRLLNDNALKESIADKAYALADAKYRWETIAQEFETMYQDVVGNRKQREYRGDAS